MKLFGQLIRTAVNVALVPVAVAKDIVTLGGVARDRDDTYTAEQLQRLKDEADEDDDA